MRASPSIAPENADIVYLVLDDLGGRLGRTWRETDEDDTDRETVMRDLLGGQYANPAWIVAFNADGRVTLPRTLQKNCGNAALGEVRALASGLPPRDEHRSALSVV